jgi:large subunit ribosomal protein L4
MKINIYNLKSEVVGEMSLPKLFETVVSEKLINQAIKVYTNNQRKSHAKAKDRGDIAGTTKKMWAQKGTGRARHSTTKASQFVGGGIAHGPQGNQNYKLRLPKAQRTLAIHAILAKFAKQKRIIVIDQFKDMSPKTKDAIKLITCLEKENEVLSKSHKIGIITNKTVISVRRAFRNIPGVKLLTAQSLNAYDLANQNYLFFSKKAINDLK